MGAMAYAVVQKDLEAPPREPVARAFDAMTRRAALRAQSHSLDNFLEDDECAPNAAGSLPILAASVKSRSKGVFGPVRIFHGPASEFRCGRCFPLDDRGDAGPS